MDFFRSLLGGNEERSLPAQRRRANKIVLFDSGDSRSENASDGFYSVSIQFHSYTLLNQIHRNDNPKAIAVSN
jgi:hypothetical protein